MASKSGEEIAETKVWEDIPPEIVVQIAKNLDVLDRTRLSLTSFSNYQTLKSATYKVKHVSLIRRHNMMSIVFGNQRYIFEFLNWPNNRMTRVKRCSLQGIRHWQYSNPNYVELAMTAFKSMVLEKKIEIENLIVSKLNDYSIFANYPKLKVKKLSTDDSSFGFGLEWFNYIQPNIQEIVLQFPIDINAALQYPAFKDAKECQLYWNYDLTDEQLLSFTFKRFHCMRRSNVTNEGINRLIGKWIAENAEVGTYYYLKEVGKGIEFDEELKAVVIDIDKQKQETYRIDMDKCRTIIVVKVYETCIDMEVKEK